MRITAPWLIGLGLTAGLAACGEEKPVQTGPTPPDPLGDVPADFEPELDEGGFAVEQRGVAVDAEDFAVLQTQDNPAAGIGVNQLKADFGLLALNLPYLDPFRGGAGSQDCVDTDHAEEARPLASAQAFLDRLKSQKDFEPSAIALTVDLFDPKATRLLHPCGVKPSFGDVDYRAALVQAFEEAAGLPNLKYLTVGVGLNRYTYFKDDQDRLVPEDYVNLMTLYREIYAAVKAKAPAVQVGPGLSWDFLMNVSVPTVASDLGLTDARGIAAWYRAWQRTVAPFLVEIGEPGQRPAHAAADFLAFSILPETASAPFRGEPSPIGEEAALEVEQYYRYLSLAGKVQAGDGKVVPIAFPIIDWPIDSEGFANQKGPFLSTFLHAVSHVDVAFAAWRRLSDLPRRVQGQVAPCDRVMESFGYPVDYCSAGLISASGNVRDLYAILTSP